MDDIFSEINDRDFNMHTEGREPSEADIRGEDADDFEDDLDRPVSLLERWA